MQTVSRLPQKCVRLILGNLTLTVVGVVATVGGCASVGTVLGSVTGWLVSAAGSWCSAGGEGSVLTTVVGGGAVIGPRALFSLARTLLVLVSPLYLFF